MSIIFGAKSNKVNDNELTPPVFEGYGCENFNGDLAAVQESYDDHLAVIESIYTLEMAEIDHKKEVAKLTEASEIEASEAAYQTVVESALKGVWENIKNVFMKMWGKLKQFFHNIGRAFDTFLKSGKDFAAKYESDIRAAASKLSNFEYSMYDYNDEALKGGKAAKFLEIAKDALGGYIATPANENAESLEKKIEALVNAKEDTMNKLRGTYVGGGNLDGSEYTKALFSHFRGGSEKKEVKISITNVITTLKGSDAGKVAADAAKDVDSVFNAEIKKINEWEKAAGETVGKTANDEMGSRYQKLVSLAQKHASAFSEAKTIALEYFRAWRTAIMERDNTYKSVCIAAISAAKKTK